MTTFTLEIYYNTGRYVLAGLDIKALLYEIARADECGRNIVLLRAYQDSNALNIHKLQTFKPKEN